jgi:hypothetical protein
MLQKQTCLDCALHLVMTPPETTKLEMLGSLQLFLVRAVADGSIVACDACGLYIWWDPDDYAQSE